MSFFRFVPVLVCVATLGCAQQAKQSEFTLPTTNTAAVPGNVTGYMGCDQPPPSGPVGMLVHRGTFLQG